MVVRYRVSKLARGLGIGAMVVAVLAAAIPLVVAVAAYRGTASGLFTLPVVGLVGTAVALIGLITCVIGAIVGRGAQSATVMIAALMNAGVVVGLAITVFLPLLLGS